MSEIVIAIYVMVSFCLTLCIIYFYWLKTISRRLDIQDKRLNIINDRLDAQTERLNVDDERIDAQNKTLNIFHEELTSQIEEIISWKKV